MVFYFNWDNQLDQKTIVAGAQAVAEQTHLNELQDKKTLIVFDEIHKYGKWKQFLKGFFDLFESRCQIIVTGSAKLNIYRPSPNLNEGR